MRGGRERMGRGERGEREGERGGKRLTEVAKSEVEGKNKKRG